MDDYLDGYTVSYSGQGNYAVFYNGKAIVKKGNYANTTATVGDIPLDPAKELKENSPLRKWLQENINNLEDFHV